MFDALIPDLASICDDKANSVFGYLFMHHSANQSWARKAELHLTQKLDTDTALQREWHVGSMVCRQTAKRYKAACLTFLRRLALAIYFTSGQPSRRPEQRILRWQNSLQGGLRNIMVCNGHVCVRSLWTKRRWTARQELPVWRVLPPSLSRILIIYIATVLPFAKCVCRSLGA